MVRYHTDEKNEDPSSKILIYAQFRLDNEIQDLSISSTRIPNDCFIEASDHARHLQDSCIFKI